ncbi:MAG: spore coat U domain-containing protein [Lysobacterales bacterium]
MINKSSLLVSASLLGLLASGSLLAATATDTFEVSINVENSCTIAVNDLPFGTVDTLATSHDASTTGTVTCTGIAPVEIAFDAGTGGTSTLATRLMEQGANTIAYNLYRDAGHTEILGDGTGGTVTIDINSSGSSDAFTVYGLTAPSQNPKPVGSYASTVTATVTY